MSDFEGIKRFGWGEGVFVFVFGFYSVELFITITHQHTHTHTDLKIQSCVAFTSSVEVSGSPWQQYNGTGLIQSQRRTVGLAETLRENWSGSESGSSGSCCAAAAAYSFTGEKKAPSPLQLNFQIYS